MENEIVEKIKNKLHQLESINYLTINSLNAIEIKAQKSVLKEMLECDHDWEYSRILGEDNNRRTCPKCSKVQEQVWQDVE